MTAREAKKIMTSTQVQDVSTFLLYQAAATRTAIYPEVGTGSMAALSYTVLGLVSEVSEASINASYWGMRRKELIAEYGDVMWYVAQIASELGTTISECVLKFHMHMATQIRSGADQDVTDKGSMNRATAMNLIAPLIAGGHYADSPMRLQSVIGILKSVDCLNLQASIASLRRGDELSLSGAKNSDAERAMQRAAGNISSTLKKVMRDHDGEVNRPSRSAMMHSLGQMVCLVSLRLMNSDVLLGQVLDSNVKKLADRQARNVLGGSGDDR